MEKSQLNGQDINAIAAQTANERECWLQIWFTDLLTACGVPTLSGFLLPVSVLTHIHVSTRDKKLENMVRLHAYMCRYPQHVSGGHVHKRICGYGNSLLRSPLFQSQHWVRSRMAVSWSHHSLPSQMRECASNPGVRRSLRHPEEQERRSGSHDLHPPCDSCTVARGSGCPGMLTILGTSV